MFKTVYIEKKSLVHSLDFWSKIISLLIILPLTAFLAQPPLLLLLITIFIILLLASQIGLKKFWRQINNYFLPITIGLFILSLLFNPGTVVIRLEQGLILSARFGLLIAFGMFFSMITNPIEFPSGFMRIGIPHRYGITLMVGYRMMPLLNDKISKIIQAQKSRGASFKFSLKQPGKFFFQIGSLIVPLLHSTLDMSVKLSDALISRGYNPNGQITVVNKKFTANDYLICFISVGLLIFSLYARS